MTAARSRWTNPSVRILAGSRDPVAVITEFARDAVARALDEGWSGPPFDPLRLADILGIEVVATEEVRDARTVSVDGKKVRIEFNPNRPRGRMRYSLAHEIAHTLFSDCSERVRNRASHSELSADDWQLEALCNIAAAEFLMPAGAVATLAKDAADIHHLIKHQRLFDVSTEALLIRAMRVTDAPAAMFCASRVERGRFVGRYRLDYDIATPAWSFGSARGIILPEDTAVSHCTGVGFTAVGDEPWGNGTPVHMECVAIPPYPGAAAPRVVGVVRPPGLIDAGGTTVAFVHGDATAPRGEGAKLIVQVVNDKTANWGGAGFAVGVRRTFPAVQEAFREWAEKPGNLRLGNVHFVEAGRDTSVVSIVAQRGYGESTRPKIRYGALRSGLADVAARASTVGASIHMPRIGCGEAGGSWEIVEELVRAAFRPARHHVTVYDLPDHPFSQLDRTANQQQELDLH
jgi:O-acetyl-ADP-ribose deacetylase (regulator of RNase III)